MLWAVKEKSNIWLPIALMFAFALTRWPGLLWPNFSAAYALCFCAGVFLPRKLAWWLPLATMFATDVVLNVFYYQVGLFHIEVLFNYTAFAAIIWLGTRFKAVGKWAWLKIIGGGILSAVLFYLITNTCSWFFNPYNNREYVKTLVGWIIALTKGTEGYPQTWEFFRSTLLSGGLFTAFFVGAMKLGESAEAKEKEEEKSTDAEPEPEKAEA